MSEMIERVARALWAIDCRRGDEDERRAGRNPPERWADPWHPSGCGVRQQKTYLEDARAAIAAMREPTEDQLRAGEQDLRDQYDRSYWEDAKDVAETAEVRLVYWAMIDEALK